MRSLQQRDEGQEQRAVEAAFVEPVRLDIRGRDHDDAMREQGGEEPPEDHRIGDIGDGELVEAEDPRLLGEGLRATGAIGSSPLHLAGLELLAPRMDALVHVGHEGVEMDPALAAHAERLEEQVHQHRLAAPDRAPDVEPARLRRRLALAEEPAERARLACEPVLARARLPAGSSRLNERDLRRIALDGAGGDEPVIARGDGVMEWGWSVVHGRSD